MWQAMNETVHLGDWISANASDTKRNRYSNIEEFVEKITLITTKGKSPIWMWYRGDLREFSHGTRLSAAKTTSVSSRK